MPTNTLHSSTPTIVSIFGVTGDLTKRKLIPALYNLFLDHELPRQFTILGVGRRGDRETFLKDMRACVAEFSRRGAPEESKWAEFAGRIQYVIGGFDDPKPVQLVDRSSIRVVGSVRSVNRVKLDRMKQRMVMFWASVDPADHLPAVASGLAVSLVKADLAQVVILAEGSAIKPSSWPK